ncbi:MULTISPECIES: hypothetical protein [Acidithiobacillus]|jgi:hypothetical protein|uniref:Uncharacterized protein n=2 Tax=Acidithiobacillus caldus TaxID=33059 RepID=A0A059ZT41_ACICK|nr:MULTISPECIES: hypothetical protein [Acidithiobacillus]AIA56014.1 hypothetical protein Acaty_c2160 [Acidithiobacillus caldus ATCC 51756]AUW33367.1 hypothetical protein A5904_11035 [Acidithiobacillus caldus]MBU2728786.1 hypothetical protein [Acidithiobacillus caldus]MBU2736164.1 hypothetical protein [Acidithiobacillus caldus ATCC 51756]MBU2745504.1 hypothetical protein [Acidithiobacillus caldus]
MYKRPAHIQFLSPQNPARCAAALELCAERGAGWVLAAGAEAPPQWPDLIVWLDTPPQGDNAPGSPQALLRHWPLAEPWPEDLARRIDGLLGGLRLLARMDGSGAPRRADLGGVGKNGPVFPPAVPHSDQDGRRTRPGNGSERRRKNC